MFGIVYYRFRGRLSRPNDAMLEMLGLERDDFEIRRIQWQDMIAPDSRAADEKEWDALVRGGNSGPARINLVQKNGGALPVLISRANLEAGRPEHGIAFIVNLKQLENANIPRTADEAELRRANDLLDQRVRERSAELEAQTARVHALARIRAEAESRERKRLAQVLHDQFQQLVSAAKMKVGILRRRSADAPVVASLLQAEGLLEEALNASRSLASELCPPILREGGLGHALEYLARWMEQHHGLSVQLHLADLRDPDNEQVRTILFECIRELLLNVARHSGVKSAEVSAKITRDSLLKLSIVDRGSGFDPREVQSRIDPASSFGLLSIRDRLSLIGGFMQIISAPGKGTTVEISVPAAFEEAVRPATEIRPQPADAGIPRTLPRALRVLVADDHKLFREGLISLLLQEPNLVIVGESGDGQQAVELARTLRPDVLIVDVSMPRMNGVQVTNLLSRELPQLKIVGLSMHERDDMADAMRNAGAVAYCAKNAPVEVLVNILRQAVALDDTEAAPA
jgi:signal transduction histidine kinase/ActR/RegA family two-component response regulator